MIVEKNLISSDFFSSLDLEQQQQQKRMNDNNKIYSSTKKKWINTSEVLSFFPFIHSFI